MPVFDQPAPATVGARALVAWSAAMFLAAFVPLYVGQWAAAWWQAGIPSGAPDFSGLTEELGLTVGGLVVSVVAVAVVARSATRRGQLRRFWAPMFFVTYLLWWRIAGPPATQTLGALLVRQLPGLAIALVASLVAAPAVSSHARRVLLGVIAATVLASVVGVLTVPAHTREQAPVYRDKATVRLRMVSNRWWAPPASAQYIARACGRNSNGIGATADWYGHNSMYGLAYSVWQEPSSAPAAPPRIVQQGVSPVIVIETGQERLTVVSTSHTLSETLAFAQSLQLVDAHTMVTRGC